jgi:hypothetical protein
MTYFEAQNWNFLGEAEENHGSPQSGQPEYRLGFGPTTSRMKARTLPFGPTCPVCNSLHVHHIEKKYSKWDLYTLARSFLFYVRIILRGVDCDLHVSLDISWLTVYRQQPKSTFPSSCSVLFYFSCLASWMEHVDHQANMTSTIFSFHALRTKKACKPVGKIWGYETAFGMPIRNKWMPLCYWHK